MLLATGPAALCADEAFVVAPGVRQRFVDDCAGARVAGRSRVMHRPINRGPVLKPDTPADGNLIELRAAPIWDAAQIERNIPGGGS